MSNVQYNYGDLKIFCNKYNLKPYYGCMWISYNGKYGIGFWQQITKYYTSCERLRTYNQKFKDVFYFEVD